MCMLKFMNMNISLISMYLKVHLLIVVYCFGLSTMVFAQEHGAGAEKTEAAPPEKGKYIKKDEWIELQGKIGSLLTRIKLREASIKKLIEDKNKTKDSTKLDELSRLLVIEHNDLVEAVREYEQQRATLVYRFPEKGLHKERKYKRIEVKSLNEMEKKLSLEQQIKKTMVKVRKHFPVKSTKVEVQETEAGTEKSNELGKTPNSQESIENSELAAPVIIQK